MRAKDIHALAARLRTDGYHTDALNVEQLLRERDALLALARQYAGECAECSGSGTSEDTSKDCESCNDIRQSIREAQA